MVGIPENKKADGIVISEKQEERTKEPKTIGKIIAEGEAIPRTLQLIVNTYKGKCCVWRS